MNSKVAKQFRDRLREAREYTLKDAEAFNGIIHVIESLGSFLLGRVAALGQYHDPLKKLANHSALSEQVPSLWRNFHTPFSPLFWMLARARNDAMHMGACARHLTTHAIELALVLEDALNMPEATNIYANNGANRISDYMVRDVVCAHLWEPVSFIRQRMLTNSFSYLPFLAQENKWSLISDIQIARFLQGHLRDGRNDRLAKTLKDVVADMPPESTCCYSAMDDETIETILAKFNGKPVLIFSKERKDQPIGILTAFDLL